MKDSGFHVVETRRRWLAAGVAWPALAWTGALRAQAKPPVVIGWLDTTSPDGSRPFRNAFNEGMAALGWKLGAQYLLEERHADARVERLPALAQELAAKQPAVIVAWPSASVFAAAVAAPTTPVVLMIGDPLATGLVTSLARPGGLITGLSNVSGDTTLKVIELLVEALPKLQRIGFLADSSTGPSHGSTVVAQARRASERLRVEAVIADMAKPEDIEPAMAQLAKGKAQALVILPSVWFSGHFSSIIQAGLARRWPVVGISPGIPSQGGLFRFGPDNLALARRAAHYVDRILKGAKPGDLPIEQPTTFELILNMKTARALGIAIPPSMRLRATEVIE